jgi:hypothetical protein
MPEYNRRDQFGECNTGKHPVDVFTRECCADCLNPECTRSLHGKAKFDQRTATWFERYYSGKDQMSPGDPRYPKIAAQNFVFIDPGLVGRAPEVGSAWLDPRDLTPPPAPVTIIKPADEVATGPTAPSSPTPRQVPRQLLLANVPVREGQMVAPPPSAGVVQTPTKDPWTGPVPASKDETPVVTPGARVKLGSGV